MSRIFTVQLKSSLSGVISRDEILDSISPEVMEKIKERDNHPFFQAFVTVHEGEGNPEILDGENESISWPRAAIKTVWKKVKGVIQAFRGHEQGTNSTKDRKSLGQIVGQTEKEIDGKLSHISIFYHPPEVKEEAKEYDSCSHEGQWTFEDDGKGGLIARTLEKLQAVAFLKRDETPPALSGSLKLSTVQAHETPGKGEDLLPPGKGKEDYRMDNLTFEQIKQAVKDLNIFPSQLFSIDIIQQDNGFNTFFDETKRIKDRSAELETQVETLGNKNKSLTMENEKISFKPRFNKIVEEKKLTPTLKTFLQNKFEKASFEEFTTEKIDQFITEQSGEYTEMVTLIKGNDPNEPIPLGDPPPGPPKQPDNGSMFDDLPDMSDPANNDIFDGIDLKGQTE